MSSKEEKRRVVPKFGSFKPKPPAIASPESKSEDQAQVKRSRSQKEDRHQDSRHYIRLSPGRTEREPRKEKPSREETRHDVFFVDKRGDPLILRYGGNDRARVPSYRRFGYGKVMGSEGIFEIRGIGSREEFTIKGFQYRDSAFRENQSALMKAGRVTKSCRIKQSAEVQLPDGTEDFLHLSTRKRKRDDEPEAPLIPEQLDFRFADGKSQGNEHLTSDESEADSSDQEHGEIEMSETKKRSIELSRQVKDHPEDSKSWLELVGLQEELFRESKDGDHGRTPDEIKALAEVKISMYEKALSHVGTSVDREGLLLGLMREGVKAWTPETVGRRWNEITESNSLSFALWKGRLNFELTNMATFTHEAVKNFHIQKLDELRTQVNGDSKETSRLACEQLIYVFLRLTRFLHETGFVELAAASWQAILEMTFARPADESAELSAASFGAFWESESPRIGEEGAKGWAHHSAQPTVDVPEAARFEPIKPPDTRDYFKAWNSVERRSAVSAKLPARTLDEGVDTDPFRVVVLSDIEDLLIWFPKALIPLAQPLLVDAYLLFCELPPALNADGLIASAIDDPFLCLRSATLETAFGEQHQHGAEPTNLSKRTPDFRSHGARIALSPDVLFSGPNWFRYLRSWAEPDNADGARVDRSWVERPLRFLVLDVGIESLAEYYLAIRWLNEPSTARKAAKQLLKRYPADLRLYNAYALVEAANGNAEISRTVLSSVTGQLLTTCPLDSQLLWNTWSWLELEAGQKRVALLRLCSSVDSNRESVEISPGLLLKARSHFASCRDYSLSSGNLDRVVEFAKSLILLDYLWADDPQESMAKSQGNISAAMGNARAFSREMCTRGLSKSSHHESLLQWAAKLLYYHASHGPFRPSYVREQVRFLLALFPRNTIFLALFSWSETNLRIDDPVRTTLHDLCLSAANDCVTSRIFAIRHELQHGSVHSARAAFEAAVASDACRGNQVLWICYVQFCGRRREFRALAKDVFYRAAAVCPWSKDLYMEAFGTLIKDMASAELRAVFNTMVAKGLRIHVDLDEFVDQWKKGLVTKRA